MSRSNAVCCLVDRSSADRRCDLKRPLATKRHGYVCVHSGSANVCVKSVRARVKGLKKVGREFSFFFCTLRHAVRRNDDGDLSRTRVICPSGAAKLSYTHTHILYTYTYRIYIYFGLSLGRFVWPDFGARSARRDRGFVRFFFPFFFPLFYLSCSRRARCARAI